MQKLEQFWFKYFSYATKDDENSWVRWAVLTFLTTIAVFGIFSDVYNYTRLAKIFFDTFLILFTAFGFTWIVIWIYHNIRLRRNEGN